MLFIIKKKIVYKPNFLECFICAYVLSQSAWHTHSDAVDTKNEKKRLQKFSNI